MTSANRIVLSAVWTFVAAFTAPITSAQEADPFRIRISRTPSESFQTDDVAGELRTARLQPSELEALPGARDAPGESVVDSINEGQQPTTLEDEAARRRRRRRERHSSLIFGSEYGSPVYQDSLLGSRGSARLMRTP
ncbi:MAG: hypothetical protein IH991_25360, partial [Planctomycetes bacterium]|nr:hypothetical protein [Planctomycetota bacterium]